MADLATSLLEGYRTGAQIAQERRRIAAEEARTQAEANARAATNARESALEQQRLRVEQARIATESSLRRQQLAQAQAINDARTKAAAVKFAAVQGLAKDLAAGVPMQQALYRNPGASSTADIISARRAAEQLANQSANLKLRQQEFEHRKEQDTLRANKAAKVTEPTVTLPLPKSETGDPTGTFHGTISAAQKQFGTNLPPMLQGPAPTGGAGGKKRFRWDPAKNDLVEVMAATPASPAPAAGNIAPTEPGDETPPEER